MYVPIPKSWSLRASSATFIARWRSPVGTAGPGSHRLVHVEGLAGDGLPRELARPQAARLDQPRSERRVAHAARDRLGQLPGTPGVDESAASPATS